MSLSSDSKEGKRGEIAMSRAEKFFIRASIEEGGFRYSGFWATLRSGRKFRYKMEDYPFRLDASEHELDVIACQIIKDKYRYCEWDRDHPRSNSEVEIYDVIKAWMMNEVAKARQVMAEDEAAKRHRTGPSESGSRLT